MPAAREIPRTRSPSRASRNWLPGLVLLLIAAAVRLLPALGDFWLDEVWTWARTLQVNSAAEILFNLPDENNHILNTLVVWLIGPEAHWTLYRIPAVLAGCGTILLAAILSDGSQENRLASWIAGLTVGSSYLMIHYTSEARGYAYVMLFALLAHWLLQRALTTARVGYYLGFNAACLCGFLSQLMFVYWFAAAGVWAAFHLWRAQCGLSRMAGILAGLFGPPLVFLGWLYAVFIRYLHNGGGPRYAPLDVVLRTLSLTAGGPMDGVGTTIAAVAVVAVAAWALWQLGRHRGDDRWLLDVLVIVVMPAGLLIVLQRPEVYVRYFLLSALYLQLLLAGELSRWLNEPGGRRYAAGVLLGLLLAGNFLHVGRLYQHGRGQYLAVLEEISRQTRGPVATIGSDHDFRNGMMLSYYQQWLPPGPQIQYIPVSRWSSTQPEWILTHSLDRQQQPPAELQPPAGGRYRLEQIARYAGLSGWQWHLYHRDAGRLAASPVHSGPNAEVMAEELAMLPAGNQDSPAR